MALYRRYRPQRFQDVIGQEQVTKPLMAALRANKTAHAYLFSGPRGCGKTTSARILARCLNCAGAPTDTPCGECESCRELSLEGSGSLDVVEMDAASHGGVDDARDLIERASFAPARDRFKIFIIDEAHMVSNQGFNALLKLVEEPPPHIKFIFATTEPEKVIGTIRSRTHHYPFRLVPPDTLEHFLGEICADEGIDVGAGVLPLVVRSGGGSVRDSLSVLDQLIGGSEANILNYQDAVGLLGYTDGSLLDDVVEALAANDGATVFSVVDRVVQSGHDPRRFVEDLLQRLRDLIVIALAGESATDVLASVPRDQYERMVAQSNFLGAARASRCADLVNDALSAMVGATSPRLQLELLCARLLLPESPGGESKVSRSEQIAAERPARPAAAQRTPSQQTSQSRPAQSSSARMAPHSTTPGRRINPAWAATPGSVEPAQERTDMNEGGAGTSQPVPVPGIPTQEDSARNAPKQVAPPRPAQRASEQGSASSAGTPVPSGQQTEGAQPKDAAPVGADASIIRQRWSEVVTAVQTHSRSTAALIQTNAHVGSFSGDVLVLAFQTAGLATTFNNRGHAPRVEAALHDVLGIRASVQGTVGEIVQAPDMRTVEPVVEDRQGTGAQPPRDGSTQSSQGPDLRGTRPGDYQAIQASHARPTSQEQLASQEQPETQALPESQEQSTFQTYPAPRKRPVSQNQPAAQEHSQNGPSRPTPEPRPTRTEAPADVAGVLAQLVDQSVEEILAGSTIPEGHVSSRASLSDAAQREASASVPVEEHSQNQEAPDNAQPSDPSTPAGDTFGSGHFDGQIPSPPFEDREPPQPFEDEEPFYAQQMPVPSRPRDSGTSAQSNATPPAANSPAQATTGPGNQPDGQGVAGGEFRAASPVNPGNFAATGAASPASSNGNSIASRIRQVHGGSGGFTNGGFNGYRGYSDQSAFSASTDEDDEVSADDPTIAQSNLVGIDVVLDTFNGTVIEEIVGEKEY